MTTPKQPTEATPPTLTTTPPSLYGDANTLGGTAALYVHADGLLDELFAPAARPSVRWLRSMTAARKLPFVKLGGKVLFSVAQVRAALEAQPTAKVR